MPMESTLLFPIACANLMYNHSGGLRVSFQDSLFRYINFIALRRVCLRLLY
jgi:hypothetical protein